MTSTEGGPQSSPQGRVTHDGCRSQREDSSASWRGREGFWEEVGADGALRVVRFHRGVVEHSGKHRSGLVKGRFRGRRLARPAGKEGNMTSLSPACDLN